MKPTYQYFMYIYTVSNERRIQSLLFCLFGKQFIVSDDVGITRVNVNIACVAVTYLGVGDLSYYSIGVSR
jgi:hypothetical protein